ncbi:GGDEF domain-containing protein [Sphingomicrobium lutaoense]|uniref:diguanylate cyclase n=1 Tax=Sphingomicrobium lutaoense TaxID=515949 RepID=A0A839Z0Z8_9SPHN|nr:GGDEF domain-containing protein [Sphingomicrobium lutaoense]MBB3765009.1 diguanylate cyclase (GGDEF)-like protein [Sphingomicrobium lutaoense]
MRDRDLTREVARLREENLALRQRIAEVEAMAHEDHLLCIPNRRGLMRELNRLISRCQRYRETSALLFLDLDGMKRINDEHGHIAGDAALTKVAHLLSQRLRASDVLARYGGDEFCVLLAQVDEQQARKTADRLATTVEQAGFRYEGQTVPMSVAIGIALIDDSETTPEDILSKADEAMYRKKR